MDGNEFLKHLRESGEVTTTPRNYSTTTTNNNLQEDNRIIVNQSLSFSSSSDSNNNDNNNNNNNNDNDVVDYSNNNNNNNNNNNQQQGISSSGSNSELLINNSTTKPESNNSLLSNNNNSTNTNNNNMSPNSSKPPLLPMRSVASIMRPSSVRDRKVSWGDAMNFTTTPEQQQQQQRANNGSPEDSGNTNGINNNYTYHVDDIINYEHEAEAAILRALDKRHHRKMDTGTSTILSQVASDASHEFDTFDIVSPMPLNDINDNNDDGVDLNNSFDDKQSTGKNSSTRSGGQQQSRPLLSSNHHRRVTSVDQTLHDLTQAMAAMDNNNNNRRNRKNSTDIIDDTVLVEATTDGFTRNAMLLASNAKSTRSLWGVVCANLPVVNENSSTSNKNSSTAGSSNTSDEGEEQEDCVEGADNTQHDIETGDSGSGTNNNNNGSNNRKKNKKKRKKVINRRKNSNDDLKEDAWGEFFTPRRHRITNFLKTLLLYILTPLVLVACLLYYGFNNPPTGRTEEETDQASASFILLFCCRQIVTLSLALGLQGIIIEFLGLGTKILLNIFGPIITLLIVQSKGWPHILFWWSILDFALLSGDRQFSHHWLYFQDTLNVFNEHNNSGNIVNNGWYIRILTVTVCVSVVVSIKRFLLGLYLGRQTYSHYGQQLANVMGKMLLVSEVAVLAKQLENTHGKGLLDNSEKLRDMGVMWKDSNDDNDGDNMTYRSSKSLGNMSGTPSTYNNGIIDPNNVDPLTGSLHYLEKMKLMQLLDQWEEPERHDNPTSNEIASISAVLRFRKALTFIQKRYPFSQAFGLAESRESCVESSQNVYKRLMDASPDNEVLNFETIALLGLRADGNLDHEKTKALIKVFRPDRQGNLTVLDFVKSVDSVYKEFRLLEATIENSSQIDRAFENIFNVVFYIIVFTIVLSQLGFDPFALFLSLSSIILAFAFMIGNASAKYFEGVLFILVRRPYGIGDRISVGPVEDTKPSLDGAMPWVVQNVTLFETVVTLLPTNETASLSNGSLANSRIINWARSPQAQFHIFLNFPLDTPYEKLVVFKTAIEEYMKARPREWRALNGFRVNRMYANQNYMEFIIVIQHREAWQEVGIVLDSKANLTSYCQECARQLGLQYQAPVLPVELHQKDDAVNNNSATNSNIDEDALTREFQSVARTKHQIRVC